MGIAWTSAQPTSRTPPRGSTSSSQCLTLDNYIYAVSQPSNRVTAFNTYTKQFEVVEEAGVIDYPQDLAFITENMALVSSGTKDRVNIIDSEGGNRGVFAQESVCVCDLGHKSLGHSPPPTHQSSGRRVAQRREEGELLQHR